MDCMVSKDVHFLALFEVASHILKTGQNVAASGLPEHIIYDCPSMTKDLSQSVMMVQCEDCRLEN